MLMINEIERKEKF